MKILVVDDEPDMLNLACAILRYQKHSVLQAKNGLEGLELLYREPPDLLITDVNMPEMDGFELCARIREDRLFDHLPIIIVTVRSSNVDQVSGLDLGVDDYIIKPYAPEVLVARVNNVYKRIQKTLDQNGVTGLPGPNLAVKKISSLLNSGESCSFILVNLAGFRVYNDSFGYEKGDRVLAALPGIITESAGAAGGYELFHLGEDNLLIVSGSAEPAPDILEGIISGFESRLKEFYCAQELKDGFFTATDRSGGKKKHCLMGLRLSATSAGRLEFRHFGEIIKRLKEIDGYLKAGRRPEDRTSCYLVDRRGELKGGLQPARP